MAHNQPKQPPIMDCHFNLVFLSVLGLTIGCLLLAGIVALLSDDALTATEQRIFDVSLSFFMLGSGAIIGLIGGKTTIHKNNTSDTS